MERRTVTVELQAHEVDLLRVGLLRSAADYELDAALDGGGYCSVEAEQKRAFARELRQRSVFLGAARKLSNVVLGAAC